MREPLVICRIRFRNRCDVKHRSVAVVDNEEIAVTMSHRPALTTWNVDRIVILIATPIIRHFLYIVTTTPSRTIRQPEVSMTDILALSAQFRCYWYRTRACGRLV
ncbi:hypothetical protein E1B28_002342 [Marasmius oreades]|uniref:Uncharacterized protein n=1 Tax=Marasmius oreades TaxID=181124 RepID=A0A9P7RMU5_9AGAR|nr:uncharacterized protein E1B28_002342 [Marasmius oreades]KAG7086385.1 hypothetical protein E1B28_002342 [Marasmius oreades]